MSVKKYKVYKDSGEYWLGEIPESWANIRLRLISIITKGKKPIKDYDKFEEGLYPYLSMEYLRGKSENPTYANPLEGNLLVVEEGDILILWDGSNAGEIVQAKAGVLSSTMAKIELKSDLFNSSFLNYYLQRAQQHIKNHNIGMGIPHVNGKILRDLSLLNPPLSEQHQIAAFLDYKTALMDEIIAKKERLIELLQAKRQATINEVVTGKKVWNAASQTWEAPAKVKNSGVEWLGEIPEEWEVVKLKYLVELNNNRRLDNEDYSSFKVALENIQSFTGKFVSSENEFEFEGQGNYFNVGDILFNKLRPYLSKVYHVEKAGQSVGELLVFTPSTRISSRFLFYRLMSSNFINLVNSSTYGAKMPRASWDFIGNIKMAIPDIEIQQRNSSYLDTQIQKIEDLSAKLHTQIQSLKSYRQSLISEAVTGKIDVREWEEAKINV